MRILNKKITFSFVAIILLASFLSALCHPANIAFAEKADTSSMQHVYDLAQLLSSDEISKLEKYCISYGEDAGLDIMILTHNDPTAIYGEDYIEDFEDQLPVGDRVYLLIDMYNREVFIEGYGKAETYIHSKRIDKILDEITPFLTEGDYYNACLIYIKSSAGFMKDDSDLNYDHNYNQTPQSSDPNAPNYDETWPDEYSEQAKEDSILKNIWFQLAVSLVIGGVVVAIMAYSSGGTMTAGSSNYFDHSSPGLIGRRDHYLRTTVTKVRKPKDDTPHNNSHAKGGFNSSGFRGGVSSGGRSHSTGSRKF